ncbi:hypothetical protein LZ554_000728 [Drepanopeziza brunnea f. sp. 'monogermtubi']|nr:hypothetical protein LZ554_000728 [Drepanopeziza brunnea f. sp. 'monogermtubi']
MCSTTVFTIDLLVPLAHLESRIFFSRSWLRKKAKENVSEKIVRDAHSLLGEICSTTGPCPGSGEMIYMQFSRF